MFTGKRYGLIVAAFAVPVCCCFLGIGAFLQVIVSALEKQRAETAEKECREWDATTSGLTGELREGNKELRRLERGIDELDRRIAQLLEKLALGRREARRADETATENAALRQELAHVLQQIAGLQSQIDELEEELKRLRAAERGTAGPLASKEELLKRVREAEEEQQRLQAKLDELSLEIQDADKVRNVLELSGGSKHPRQPVYVECTPTMAIIQPQGTRLACQPDEQDRSVFLEAAKRTRYVVFMIRPQGFDCFDRYRDILLATNKGSDSETQIDFGFEPVNADWILRYPGEKGVAQ